MGLFSRLSFIKLIESFFDKVYDQIKKCGAFDERNKCLCFILRRDEPFKKLKREKQLMMLFGKKL